MRELISELKLQRIYLSLDKDELVIDFEGGDLSDDLISKIKANKSLLINYLRKYTSTPSYSGIPSVGIKSNYAISDAQRRLWVLSQFEGGSVAYNMPSSIELEGEYELSLFQKSFDRLIERHEILRTVFKTDETGEVKQWILEPEELNFKIDYKDFRKSKNREEKIIKYITDDSYKVFDLEKGPLLRAALLQTGEAEYIFYFNIHHIISDGWSMQVLSKDVLAYYEAYKENREVKLEPLRIQYKDYSAWQLNQLNEATFEGHRSYWLKQLKGELPILELPSSKQRPRLKSYNGHSLSTYISEATSIKLRKYTEANGGSLFMGLLATWNVLIYRYTGQTDIITGTPVAGREHVDLENQIGFYVNTLALRNEIHPEDNFDLFYQRLKTETLMSYGHQMYPFDRLVEELNLQRNTSRNAIFDVMLVLQNVGEKVEGLKLEEAELNQIQDNGYSASKFDLEITFQELGNYLSLQVVYNEDVYEKEMVEQLLSHYKKLLNTLLENTAEKISELDYLSNAEKDQLLVTFNDTQVAYPREKTIVDLFEEQVEATPKNVAIVFEDKELMYQELNEQSNQLAHYLQKNYDIQPDDLIGIKLERSEWVIIAMLGILKSGGAYVPIDPSYPQARINYILKDTNCKVCIDKEELCKFKEHQKEYSEGKVISITKSNHLAYAMYTSGSTGIPKGVMIEHKSVIRLVKNANYMQMSSKDKILGLLNFSFDGSVFDIFMPLLNGGELVISLPDVFLDFEKFAKIIEYRGIKGFLLTTALFNSLVDSEFKSLNQLSYILFGGEQVSVNHVIKFKQLYPGVKILHVYGPTENATFSTVYTINHIEPKALTIPIGPVISNSSVYILDEYNKVVPIGVTGELCVGGDGLSRGYLNKPDLTLEKFIKNPFKDGERLYKTGDLGRWTRDGDVEFIGRKDNQVKIRGYRIELGEIEHALLKNEAVKEAVVIARSNVSNEKELVAYLVSENEQNIVELRNSLKLSLPDYMIPSYFVQLEALPLTSNGKIDRKALPNPEAMGLSSGLEYVAPRNEREQKLVEIWQTLLQREQIGVTDDFFILGGHSLKAIRLISEYHQVFDVKLSIQAIFNQSTIEGHAALLAKAKKEAFVEIERTVEQVNYLMSDAQRRLWVLSQFEGGSSAYNMPSSIELEGEYELSLFQKSFDRLIERHEVLRTVFKADEQGEIKQWILQTEELGFKIDYKDFRKSKNKEEKITTYIADDSYKVFDLEQGPLLRAALLQTDKLKYVFYFNMHHIISDGWSMEVLSKEVFAYYEAYRGSREPSLQPLRIQYKDYSAWQLNQLNEEVFKEHRSYWLEQLKGELPILELPSSKQRPRLKSYNGHGLSTYINAATSIKLKKYTEANGGSLFMGLLAAWNVLMYRYTGQTDIIIGTPVAGREHVDLENQIGFYVNTLALRNEINLDDTFNLFYQRLKTNTLTSYNHQMYPFDRLVDELHLQRDTSRSALFDVMLVLQNVGEKVEGIKIEEAELNGIIDHGYSASKFDLEITFQELGDYLSLQVVYNEDVYEKEMVSSLLNHYKQLLQTLLESPEEKLSEIDYLSQAEKEQLLVTFNDTQVAYPSDKTIVDLFEEQVEATPTNVAVIFEQQTLTYSELNEHSNQLAHYLQTKYHIEPDDLIGIKLERSEWMLIAILGVLKSGAAYVPIDPTYPQERIDYIEQDTNCKVCIDNEELSKFKASKVNHSNKTISSAAKPSNLAYVIYTSGSTGNPKGVMIEHGSLVNKLFEEKTTLLLRKEIVSYCFTNYVFDVSLLEMIFPLIFGGRVILPSWQITGNTGLVLEEIITNKVNLLQVTPTYLTQLISNFSKENMKDLNQSLERICVGGESLNTKLVDLVKEKFSDIILNNHYGPTEITIDAIVNQDIHAFESNIIGKPLGNTKLYIIDVYEKLVPLNVTGEIVISGPSLARGYLNKQELTAGKFIKSPFKEGERLYKTGDLGRWTSDGNIEFIGRKDNQVKIRGYRIELGEIEHALLKNKAIKEAVVIVKENQSSEKELVAYLVSENEQNIIELRNNLKLSLPDYMIPSYFVQLDALPLTSNGKIDRKALPNPEGMQLISGMQYIAPNTELEKELVKIWELVLMKENIGIEDDFFTLGGHSIKIIQVIKEYKFSFSIKVPLDFFFSNLTIRKHAEYISQLGGDSIKSQESLIKLNIFSESNEIVVMIPPIQGEAIYFMGFSKFIETTHNCYGISYGINHDFKSLKELSEYYASAIYKQFSGRGITLNIMGFSMGVPIAFEIVKILEGLNFTCQLFMIDRMPNTKSLLNMIHKTNSSDENKWLNEQVAIATEISPNEDLPGLRKGIIHNLSLLDKYSTNGKIKSNIYCLESNESAQRMELWKKYTRGTFKRTEIKSAHDAIFEARNYKALSQFIGTGDV